MPDLASSTILNRVAELELCHMGKLDCPWHSIGHGNGAKAPFNDFPDLSIWRIHAVRFAIFNTVPPLRNLSR